MKIPLDIQPAAPESGSWENRWTGQGFRGIMGTANLNLEVLMRMEKRAKRSGMDPIVVLTLI